MELFTDHPRRSHAALTVYDPFAGEWLMRLVDPWSASGRAANVAWWRIGLLAVVLWLPHVLFASSNSAALGGQMRGIGGFLPDVGVWGILFFFLSTLTLLPFARRVFGNLINELILHGTAPVALRSFRESYPPKNRLLRALESLTRVSGWRGRAWHAAMLAQQAFTYRVFLTDEKATWHSHAATSGSLFSQLSIGSEQPNAIGIWNFLVFNPVVAYLVLLVARIMIDFACLCAELARIRGLRVLPTHPDGAGGLEPVGQTAVLLSAFTFFIGLDLAGMTVNELMVNSSLLAEQQESTNIRVLVALWFAYLVGGTLLFFLPLMPLRERMIRAKRRYILQAANVLKRAEPRHLERFAHDNGEPRILEGVIALNALIKTASDMTVWPFDRNSFLRYAGLFVSPVAPLAANLLPGVLATLKKYLGIA